MFGLKRHEVIENFFLPFGQSHVPPPLAKEIHSHFRRKESERQAKFCACCNHPLFFVWQGELLSPNSVLYLIVVTMYPTESNLGVRPRWSVLRLGEEDSLLAGRRTGSLLNSSIGGGDLLVTTPPEDLPRVLSAPRTPPFPLCHTIKTRTRLV